jgi:hypothetical protein
LIQWYLYTWQDITKGDEKIIFVCSLLTEGTMLKWKINYLLWVEKEISFGRAGDSYQGFLEKLDNYFADPYKERRAKEAIANMWQGSGRGETFFARFKMAQMEAGYNNIFHEDYMVNLLYKVLNYKIVERIFSIHPLPTLFNDWKHHTIQIDQNMQMFRDITSYNYQSGSTI